MISIQYEEWVQQSGIYSITFGLHVGELFQHADPTHRDTDTIFQDEIAKVCKTIT